MKVDVDFNQELIDLDGEPIKGSDPSDKQRREIQRLTMVANHNDSSLEEATDALAKMVELSDSTMKSTRLGEITVRALTSPDEKADGKQVLERTKLAGRIQSIDTEEFPVVSLNDKHRKWITEALERAFAKSSPVVYANAHGMINGEEEEEEEDDAN
jgi:hypothetical protein